MVVVGDNGAPNDTIENLLNRNGGLRGGKGNLYEGGIRELFIVRWPGTVPAGVVNSNTVISTLDLLPTYCDLAGIPLPQAPFAGENMSDVLRGSTVRTRPLFWEYGSVSGLSRPAQAGGRAGLQFMRDRTAAPGAISDTARHAEATTWWRSRVCGRGGATRDPIDKLV
jgi:arylsulfatase A-like enzyme